MEGALWSQCGTSFSEMLLTSTSYNVFLILLLGVLALKTRGIRDNYRESTYIGFSILVTVPIWIAWTIAGWILQVIRFSTHVSSFMLSSDFILKF